MRPYQVDGLVLTLYPTCNIKSSFGTINPPKRHQAPMQHSPENLWTSRSWGLPPSGSGPGPSRYDVTNARISRALSHLGYENEAVPCEPLPLDHHTLPYGQVKEVRWEQTDGWKGRELTLSYLPATASSYESISARNGAGWSRRLRDLAIASASEAVMT